MFVEFQLLDSSLVYYPGCPDPVMEAVELNFSEMITDIEWTGSPYVGAPELEGQYLRMSTSGFNLGFHYYGGTGGYRIFGRYPDLLAQGYSTDGLFGTASHFFSNAISIPFDPLNTIDEDGLSFDPVIWGPNLWPYYANYITLLPYWHYAE